MVILPVYVFHGRQLVQSASGINGGKCSCRPQQEITCNTLLHGGDTCEYHTPEAHHVGAVLLRVEELAAVAAQNPERRVRVSDGQSQTQKPGSLSRLIEPIGNISLRATQSTECRIGEEALDQIGDAEVPEALDWLDDCAQAIAATDHLEALFATNSARCLSVVAPLFWIEVWELHALILAIVHLALTA